jgi:hypothetical protein
MNFRLTKNIELMKLKMMSSEVVIGEFSETFCQRKDRFIPHLICRLELVILLGKKYALEYNKMIPLHSRSE